MRLAYFSPFSPQQSGISDYSEELLPHLARYAELDLFFSGETLTSQRLTEQFAVYPIRDFPVLRRKRRYDSCLYNMGNNAYHTAIYATLRRYPGIAVLHEHRLHDFFLLAAVREGDWANYYREVAYNTDPAFMPNFLPEVPTSSLDLPLARRVIDLSLGLIVHNQEMARRVLGDKPQARVTVTPMGMPLPTQLDAESLSAIRRKLNLPAEAYIVANFGHLNPSKRIDVVLRAFAKLRQQQAEAICLIIGRTAGVGTDTADVDLRALLDEVGLDAQTVVVTGFVPKEVLPDYIQAADVCVNLRYPVYGETSAAALRLMTYGKPLIVSDVATFAELPDEVCIRVQVDAVETEMLYRYLLLLAKRPDLRLQLGRNARRYAQKHHSLDYAACEMAKAVENILADVKNGSRGGWYG